MKKLRISLASLMYNYNKSCVDSTYMAFHNVLRDYKHLKQGNQRTYLNGIVHSHGKTEEVFFFFDN